MLLGQSLALAANACVGMSVVDTFDTDTFENDTFHTAFIDTAPELTLTSDMQSGGFLGKSSGMSAMSAHCQAMAEAMQHHANGDMAHSHAMNSGVLPDSDSAVEVLSTSPVMMSMDCGDASALTACDHCQNSGCSSAVMALESGAFQHWNGTIQWTAATAAHYNQTISSLFKPPIIPS